MTKPRIDSIAPFFIVSCVSATMGFYREKLGFETMFEDPKGDPFFAIVRRDSSRIFLKHGGVQPMPNSVRNAEMKWDAYVSVPDPDGLAAEFAGSGVSFHKPLMNTSERLRGFEVRDPDGYVLFFGRPQ